MDYAMKRKDEKLVRKPFGLTFARQRALVERERKRPKDDALRIEDIPDPLRQR